MSGAGDHLQKLANAAFGGSTSSLASNGNLKHKNSITNMMLMPSTTGLISGGGVGTTMMNLANNRYVKLNVGGRLFTTSLDTLTKQDSMLRAMFSGRLEVATDQDGYVLIDRCGRHFELILDYLRDDDSTFVSLHLAEVKSELELYEILKEAKFYCIQPLVALIESKIMSNKADVFAGEPFYGSSIVSMITSKSELAKILNSTDKPCIRLLFNRHNNKYSYTNTSDDNLLKNIELFERMAIKFKNRIMFIKDTTNTEEICCWYFHGGGKKLAEVCCTSIVYTTEKKQTKVEFPDSKILEEIFVNAVLFESKETASSNGGTTNNENSSSSGQLARGASSTDQNDMDSENYVENDVLGAAPRLSLSATCNQIVSTTTNNNNTSSNSASVGSAAANPPQPSLTAASLSYTMVTSSSPSTLVNTAASSTTNPNTSNIVGAISSGVSSLSLNSNSNANGGNGANSNGSNTRRGGSSGASGSGTTSRS